MNTGEPIKSADAEARDVILSMARSASVVGSVACISVLNIASKSGANEQTVRHVLVALLRKKVIKIQGDYEGDGYFEVELL